MPIPLKVLVLCTGNSARSQMAEALLNTLGKDVVYAESAGSHPAPRVNPLAIETLANHGLRWPDRTPRGIDAVIGKPWDLVITVCDNARESCPVLPGAPMTVHWGMPDPAENTGSIEARREAFEDAFLTLEQRIGRMLALPIGSMARVDLQRELRALSTA